MSNCIATNVYAMRIARAVAKGNSIQAKELYDEIVSIFHTKTERRALDSTIAEALIYHGVQLENPGHFFNISEFDVAAR